MRQCQALDQDGRKCHRPAVRCVKYHGDGEIYGYGSDGWAVWVKVWLCDQHSEAPRQREAEGGQGR